jgi:SAM-dependent methyltransferase
VATPPEPGERWRTVARSNSGEDYPRRFAEHFARLADAGEDVHGEAAYLTGLVPPGARVLDAGCGTGRVAARLADLGYDVVGVDVDDAMVEVARELHPDLRWVVSDLAALDLGEERFDAVVLAGNVVPFLEVAELPTVARRLASHLVPGGLLVSGFGLDPAHLPPGTPVVPLAAWDAALGDAGLTLGARHGGWDGSPYTEDGYAVSVHRDVDRDVDDDLDGEAASRRAPGRV